MTLDVFQEQARRYYEGTLRAHGVTARGVDWNSAESQIVRFRQFARLLEDDPEATVVDYGCGYGALAVYLRTQGHRGRYTGFDVSGDMVAAAVGVAGGLPDCRFTSDRAEVEPADYTIASGIFNVRVDAADEAWRDYLLRTVEDIRSVSGRGFGFNALTSYSDPDKRRADLYYADPLELFDHCRRTYSRRVSLLHDYELYEFTILVRL